MFKAHAKEKNIKIKCYFNSKMMSVSAVSNMRLNVFANNSKGNDIGKRLKQKVNRMKGFQKKISDDRKKNVLEIAKDIDDLVKSEISKTKSMIDEHIEFFQQEWEQDKEDCDIRNPLMLCGEEDIEEETLIGMEGEDYFE